MPRDYKVGLDLTPVIISADGDSLVAVRTGRVKLRLQNRGTAVCGISLASTTPASLDACSILLAPGTAVDDGLGDYFELDDSYRPIGVKFGASGTKKLAITEVSNGNTAGEIAP